MVLKPAFCGDAFEERGEEGDEKVSWLHVWFIFGFLILECLVLLSCGYFLDLEGGVVLRFYCC